MRRFALDLTIYLSIGLDHVALPTTDHAYRNIFRNIFGNREPLRAGSGGRPHRRLEGAGRRRQHPRRRMQWQHVGRGGVGESSRRPRQEQSRCLKTEQADAGHADPARHEEDSRASINGKAKSTTPRTARPTVPRSSRSVPTSLKFKGCVLGFLCGGETWTRVAPPDTLEPGQQHGQRRAEEHAARCPKPVQPNDEPRAANSDRQNAGSKAGRGSGASGRPGRRYLSTPRHRAVCPLTRAGTATPRPAS